MVYNQTFYRGVDEADGNGERYLKWGDEWRVSLKILPRTSWNRGWVNANIIPKDRGNIGSQQPLTPHDNFFEDIKHFGVYHMVVCLFLLAFCFGKIRFRQP